MIENSDLTPDQSVDKKDMLYWLDMWPVKIGFLLMTVWIYFMFANPERISTYFTSLFLAPGLAAGFAVVLYQYTGLAYCFACEVVCKENSLIRRLIHLVLTIFMAMGALGMIVMLLRSDTAVFRD